jgi:hypothetical protein
VADVGPVQRRTHGWSAEMGHAAGSVSSPSPTNEAQTSPLAVESSHSPLRQKPLLPHVAVGSLNAQRSVSQHSPAAHSARGYVRS